MPNTFDNVTGQVVPLTDAQVAALAANEAARAAAVAALQQQWGVGNVNYHARVAWYAANDARLLNALTDQALGDSTAWDAYASDLAAMKRQYPKPQP